MAVYWQIGAIGGKVWGKTVNTMNRCPHPEKVFDIDEMQADHIDPWSKGGQTIPKNCQLLCEERNRRKGAT